MQSIDFGYAIPIFLILLLSLSIHEAAHAWTANRLGDPTAKQLGRITINPLAHIDWIGTVLFPLIALLSNVRWLLGWAKPVPVDPRNFRAPRRDFAIVAAAGPISNLIIAAVCAVMYRVLFINDVGTSRDIPQWFAAAASLNIVLAVFNLIPVPPLDGGNVAMGLLPIEAARLVNQLRPYGFIILYALMFTGVLGRIISPIADAISNVLLPPIL